MRSSGPLITILSLLSFSSLPACSGSDASTGKPLAAAAALTVSSESIYAKFAKIPAATADAEFSALQQLSPTEYYSLVDKISPNKPMTIDGRFVNALAKPLAQNPQVTALAAQFPNMKAYWDSIGVTSARVSASDFAAGIASLLGQAPGAKALALADAFADDGKCTSGLVGGIRGDNIAQKTHATVATVISALNDAASNVTSDYPSANSPLGKEQPGGWYKAVAHVESQTSTANGNTVTTLSPSVYLFDDQFSYQSDKPSDTIDMSLCTKPGK